MFVLHNLCFNATATHVCYNIGLNKMKHHTHFTREIEVVSKHYLHTSNEFLRKAEKLMHSKRMHANVKYIYARFAYKPTEEGEG